MFRHTTLKVTGVDGNRIEARQVRPGVLDEENFLTCLIVEVGKLTAALLSNSNAVSVRDSDKDS